MTLNLIARDAAHVLAVLLLASTLTVVAGVAVDVVAAPPAAACGNSGVTVVGCGHSSVSGCNGSTAGSAGHTGSQQPVWADATCRRIFGDHIWGWYVGTDYSTCGVRPGHETVARSQCVVRQCVVVNGTAHLVAQAPAPWNASIILWGCLGLRSIDVNPYVPCGSTMTAVPQLSYMSAPDSYHSGSPLVVSRPFGSAGCLPPDETPTGGGRLTISVTGPAYPPVGGELRPHRFTATTGAGGTSCTSPAIRSSDTVDGLFFHATDGAERVRPIVECA